MFGEAVRHVVDQLHDHDVQASADAKNLHRAGVWVTPATIDWDRLDDTTATVTLDLNLIGPPTDALDALETLDALVAKVRDATDVREFDAVTYPLTGRTLPGYRGTITVEVSRDPDIPDHPEPLWADDFTNDVTGWSAYGRTPTGTWVPPGALRLESSSDAINWTPTTSGYTPGSTIHVVSRMRIVTTTSTDVQGPNISFNFGGTEAYGHIDGWPADLGVWAETTSTVVVPASYNPNSIANLRLGIRFASGGQSVIEIDSVKIVEVDE